MILLSAFRLGAWGTAVSTILISAVVATSVSLKLGPFYSLDISLTAKLIIMQLFLLSCFAVGFPVTAILAGKEKIRSALREHRDLSNSMLQNMREVIFRTDARGEWVFLNPAWEDLTGLTVEETIGTRVSDIISPDEVASLNEKFPTIQSEKSEDYNFECRFIHSDGTPVHVELSMSVLHDAEGVYTGTVGNIRDITERKAMEINLVAARRHAEAAADAKSRFLANMSHEIRTPMNGVLGFTQLLLDSEMSAEQRQQTQMIYDSGNAMMRLLNDILDISKIEAGQFKSNREPIDIAHVLDSCIKLMAPSADQKSLDISLEIHPSVPEKTMADSHHLRQVILNLLGNAVKFTPAGKINVSASTELDGDDNSMIVIEVADTGIGISRERLDHIFEPFEQAESTTAQEFGGSGLGLTISQQLATIMNGALHVESEPDKGTKFQLKIPNNINHHSQQREKKTVEIELLTKPIGPPHSASAKGKTKGRILLVEDHDVNQMLIRAMTERLGYETELAVDGAEAVQMVDDAANSDRPFDLVLMDIQMPVMDGYQATQMIRASGVTEQTLPIIAITANAYSDDIESCIAVGMQAHISKPVMIGKLQSALDDWIKKDGSEHKQPKNRETESFLTGELAQKYEQRKEEVLYCLTSLVRSATYSDRELREAADHLHKLAGTAALFGDADLGIQAKLIENGLILWKVDDRPANIKRAVSEFLKAA